MVVVVMTKEIMEAQNLFWQYPAITEKTFYEQNKDNENFIGFPWATMIDKRIHPKTIIEMLRIFVNPNNNYYTCKWPRPFSIFRRALCPYVCRCARGVFLLMLEIVGNHDTSVQLMTGG